MLAALSLALVLHAVAPSRPPSGPEPAGSPAGTDVRDEAARAFAAGERAWARGDHAEAATQFARAQELVPHPDTLYNLGLAQRRADDPVAAWHTFTTLSRTATTNRQRREAESQRARVRREIAEIEVRVDPGQHVCVDDVPLPAGERRMVKAGAHVVTIDEATVPVRVEGGETRTLERVGASSASPRWRPRDKALFGVAIGSAAAALGLGLGAAIVDERNAGRGLAFGAAASAGVAAASTIVLLATLPRQRITTKPTKARTTRSSGSAAPSCGG